MQNNFRVTKPKSQTSQAQNQCYPCFVSKGDSPTLRQQSTRHFQGHQEHGDPLENVAVCTIFQSEKEGKKQLPVM